MKDYKIIRESPFSPGTIVKPQDFVGREELIEKIIRYIPTVINGSNRNFYIIGNRGMGKSSLSSYLDDILENQFQIIPIYISNEGIKDLDSLVFSIVQNLLNKIRNTNSFVVLKNMSRDGEYRGSVN